MANLLNKFIMARILVVVILLLSIILTILVTIFCFTPIIIAGIIKLLLPVPVIWRKVSHLCDFMTYYQCEGLAVLLHLSPRLQWEIHGLEGLSKKNWYLLIYNHRSQVDIVVLCVLSRKHIPANEYFLKQQLAWVPFLGLVCWTLNMPSMKCYSRAYLSYHPERRGKNIETTRRSCERFYLHPTTIVSSVEGSRFTQEKHQQAHSSFQNLLPPKAANTAMTLNVLGKQFDKLLNVTLYYPDNNHQPFFNMLSSKLTRAVMHVNLQPITDELHGDYISDKGFKHHLQQWPNSLWQEKGRLLASLMSSQRQEK